MEKQTGSGRPFSQHLGQKFGQKFGQKVAKKLGKEIAHKSEAIGQKFDHQVDQLAETVTTVAQTASQTARAGLDEILLNLEKRGVNIKEKQELINRVGQTVLERAEKIRAQISEHPAVGAYAPSWMKEPLVKSDVASSTTEATVSEPALDMQGETLQTEMAVDLAEEVAEQIASDESEVADEAKPRKKAKSGKTKSARSSK